jgi:hypothetical protein
MLVSLFKTQELFIFLQVSSAASIQVIFVSGIATANANECCPKFAPISKKET